MDANPYMAKVCVCVVLCIITVYEFIMVEHTNRTIWNVSYSLHEYLLSVLIVCAVIGSIIQSFDMFGGLYFAVLDVGCQCVCLELKQYKLQGIVVITAHTQGQPNSHCHWCWPSGDDGPNTARTTGTDRESNCIRIARATGYYKSGAGGHHRVPDHCLPIH